MSADRFPGYRRLGGEPVDHDLTAPGLEEHLAAVRAARPAPEPEPEEPTP